MENLRYIQNLEYMESLRNDIEKDIINDEKELDLQECKRACIEECLIDTAELEDYEQERCNLSPKSLRLKRLEFYTPDMKKTQCIAITKNGKRCKKYSKGTYCFFHIKD